MSGKAKDWHSSKDIRKRARYLLEHPDEQIPSDVSFLVGDGQNGPQKMFSCHKFILAMVSSMFQAMFYGSFPQTEDIIKVPDVTPAAFQHMLRYAYGQNIDLDDECLETALDTLYCAKKYLIDKLARTCRDFIQLDITVYDSDPCVVLQRAPQIDEEDLAALALRDTAHHPNVMERDDFPRLSFDCVKRIVDDPHLKCKETDIYEGVRRWVELNVGVVTGSALREAFGSLLYSIRFPLFSAAELADGPVADGLLTSDEVSSLFQFLFSKVKPTLPFVTTHRNPLASAWRCCFKLVTAPAGTLVEGLIGNKLRLWALPDLAPECSKFLRHLVESKLHIRIACFDNEHPGQTAPLPAAVMQEHNVLSHSLKGACWFEWDIEGGTACNIRIGIGKKPHFYHSAVMGYVLNAESGTVPAVGWWADKRVCGVADFRIA